MQYSFLKYYKAEDFKFFNKLSVIEQRTFLNTHNKINSIKDNASNFLELTKYSCTQHKTYEETLNNILCGLTKKEFEILQKITLKVQKLTKLLGNENNLKSSLIAAIYQKRIVESIFNKKTKFLEIGGGSGYLSLLLCLDNINIDLYDLTEGYYIFQNLLFESLKINNELASKKYSYKNTNKKINHIPWWIFKDLDKLDVNYDVIMINNAICEFNDFSLSFIFNHICKILNYPTLFFIGSGKEQINKMDEIIEKLIKKNYFLEKKNTYLHSPSEIYTFRYNKSEKLKKIKIFTRIYKKILKRKKFQMYKGNIQINHLDKFYKKNKVTDNQELIFFRKIKY